ncbi:MAG: class I SAM-dependent methyltransferase [Gemmatimonadota bacterium]|nr:class I SAM-dependent methyltransferase [Gemmatimonadota bacterium]
MTADKGLATSPTPGGDPYSRTEYRRLIAWTPRIEREAPWLMEVLAEAPDRSVLDIGPGTGEHTAFFADQGARAVGLDASPSMIESAKEYEAQGRGRFILGDAREADRVLEDEPPFGMAICLGNVLPHLTGDEDLEALFGAMNRVLLPGGKLLIQILNYDRILSQGLRHLPLNFRSDADDGEIVFLRLMTPADDGRILFFPTTLRLDPTSEEPVSVSGSKRVELRAWNASEVSGALDRAGFAVTLHGDMQGGAFDVSSSPDLVVLATRGAP